LPEAEAVLFDGLPQAQAEVYLSFLGGLGYELDDGEREQVTGSETTGGGCRPPEWAGDRHRRWCGVG
jgi:hypothetical protein